jgi:flagellar basal body-associated protein FliL
MYAPHKMLMLQSTIEVQLHAMKQTNTKIVTGEGAARTRKQRLFKIGVPIVVVILLLGIGAGWYFTHRDKGLTTEQRSAKNTLSDQQQNIQQETQANAPNEVKANSYANLAVSYAVAGQCTEAQNALHQAQAIAPSDMKQDLKDTASTVSDHC